MNLNLVLLPASCDGVGIHRLKPVEDVKQGRIRSRARREHAALLKAVRRGDVATAQSRVTKHLRDTGELLHRVLCQHADF